MPCTSLIVRLDTCSRNSQAVAAELHRRLASEGALSEKTSGDLSIFTSGNRQEQAGAFSRLTDSEVEVEKLP